MGINTQSLDNFKKVIEQGEPPKSTKNQMAEQRGAFNRRESTKPLGP